MYPKLKKETYNSTGGINSKVSQYIAQEGEYINLQNVDFRTVGALSSFAGSSPYTIVGSTSPINGLANFPTSYFSGGINEVATDSYNVSAFAGTTFFALFKYIFTPNSFPTSFALLNNYMFGCNVFDHWTYNGSTVAWQFSLGKPVQPPLTISTQGAGAVPGLSGYITMFYSLVRQDGLFGPALGITYQVLGNTLVLVRLPIGPNLRVGSGLSLGSFGLSGIFAWVQLNNNIPVGFPTLFGVTTGGNPGLTLTFGFTTSWTITSPQPEDFQGSFLYGLGSTQGSENGIYLSPGANGFPFTNETFANQLFTALYSRVVYSNIGEPEKSDYENFFDVALDDPNPITAMRKYFTQLLIWKRNSTYALSGSGPDTFVLSEVSSIYGCLSPNSACVWNQTLWFLDSKGICEFNGANVQCVSSKVQPIFDRMNVVYAPFVASMVHVKLRNEIWCAIPIDGSTTNNIIVVYDYLSNAWTTRTVPPGDFSALSVINTVPAYGSSGFVGTFSSSMVGDAGSAFTSIIKSRFIEGDMGNSVTKEFRRLFVDASIPVGQTYPITVNFYADKSSAAIFSTTMGLSAYQNRIDYGITAKSLAVEFIYSGMSFLQFNGFTIEYRFQRAV